MTYNLLDLFSGIGGFSLGLERSGAFKTVAFCEIEPYCQKVLAKHWPQVPIYDDVRTITAERLAADGIAVDAICGGFPCQDISTAGKGAGLEGERSGLWFEYARIISELRPQYVIVENVSALLNRGLDRVLGTLAEVGYDAEWHCIPASAVGAPHRRDRVWIVAYTSNKGADWREWEQTKNTIKDQFGRNKLDRSIFDERDENVAYSKCKRLERHNSEKQLNGIRERLSNDIRQGCASTKSNSLWSVEPDVGRVANGVPARSHRLKALGNAVVPQIPELIGRAIAQREASL